MPILSMVNQQSIHLLKRYYDDLAPLKKLMLPWGVRVALSHLVVSKAYSVSAIEPLIHAFENSWSFLRRKNSALLAFEHSPLIQAYAIASDELANIAKSDKPVDIANAFTSLQQLNLLGSDYSQQVATHPDPEYLAKALGVLLSMRPLPTEKKKIFFEVIIKSMVPLAIAKVLSSDSSDLFYGRRLPASVVDENCTMLAKSRFPQTFREALSHLQENAARIFLSDLAIMVIRTIGAHPESFKAAQLIVYLFNKALLTSDNCERVAMHSNPLALLRALDVSIDNEDKLRLAQRGGIDQVRSLLQANFEILSTDPSPESRGFSLIDQSQKLIAQRIADLPCITIRGSFFPKGDMEYLRALDSFSLLSAKMASSSTLAP